MNWTQEMTRVLISHYENESYETLERQNIKIAKKESCFKRDCKFDEHFGGGSYQKDSKLEE